MCTGKHTAVFELAQLVGITSTMYTCVVFLDPYIKGFLFGNSLGRSGVRGPTRRTEAYIFTVFGLSKVKNFELL